MAPKAPRPYVRGRVAAQTTQQMQSYQQQHQNVSIQPQKESFQNQNAASVHQSPAHRSSSSLESHGAPTAIPMQPMVTRQQQPPSVTLSSDSYHITLNNAGTSLLRSTFFPTGYRAPVYEVTTDSVSSNKATTTLWSFDVKERTVREVAKIYWASSGKTMVEMSGVKIPVADFLTRSKWRLGVTQATATFTSQMEEYKWVPQPTLFDSESCMWHCVVPIARGPASGPSTVLSVYRPPGSLPSVDPQPQPLQSTNPLRRHRSNQSTSWRSSISSDSIHSHYSSAIGFNGMASIPVAAPTPQPQAAIIPSAAIANSIVGMGHGATWTTSRSRKSPAILEMFPEINTKPYLREVIVLTAILVVVSKDEWNIFSQDKTHAPISSSDAVLNRLVDLFDPTNSM
ncbi:5735_t:CDS:2, partial [Acaulospora colombiana]